MSDNDNDEKFFEESEHDEEQVKNDEEEGELPSDEPLLQSGDDSEEGSQQQGRSRKRKGDKIKEKKKKKKHKKEKKNKKRHNLDEEEFDEEQFDEEGDSIRDYFDEEASESENDEMEDYGDDQNELREREAEAKMYNQPRYNEDYYKQFREADEEDINKRYTERGRMYGFDGEGSFPTADDPKVFVVAVKKGKEQSLALALLNKAAQLKNDPNKRLKIFSVLARKRQYPGYIFIEAKTDKAARHALDGFQDVYISKLEELKPQQYEMLFSVKRQVTTDISKGNYVRIKGGVYDQDLGKVDRVHKTGVDVWLVPRINVQEFCLKTQEIQKKYEGTEQLEQMLGRVCRWYTNHRQTVHRKNRPPKKLIFDGQLPTTIKQVSKLTLRSEGLIKYNFKFSEVTREVGTITPMELQAFNKDSNMGIAEFVQKELPHLGSALNVIKGDEVEVISGDTIGMHGVVLQVKPKTVVFAWKKPGGGVEEIEEPMEKLVKKFRHRQNVRVISGNDKGKTGIILKIENRVATIFTENENEILVNVNNLTLTRPGEGVHDEDSREEFKKYELIKIQNGVGIILSHIKNTLKILDLTNSIKTISVMDFDSKIDTRRNLAKNSYGENIKNGAIVRVNGGPFAGKRCEVKHVFKDYLFLYNTDFYVTSGIAVEKVTNCSLVTAGTEYRPRQGFGNFQQRDNRGGFNRDQKGDDELQIGKSITIKSGMYKGYQGVIMNNMNPSAISVKLTAKGKVVQVNKDDILAVKKTMEMGKTPRLSGSTYGMPSPAAWNESRHERNDYD